MVQNIGEIAQMVERRTENPCVPSSILGLATILMDEPAILLSLYGLVAEELGRGLQNLVQRCDSAPGLHVGASCQAA